MALTLAVAMFCGGKSVFAKAATLNLVAPGVTPQIIVAPTASASEKFAARELADYLGKISGQTLAVRETAGGEAGSTPGPRIIVGHHPQNASLHPEKLGVEESIVSVEPTRVRIVGGMLSPVQNAKDQTFARDRGTLYGVYHFLERLGVRWYRPEPWGEHVPRYSQITLRVGQAISKPTYRVRMGINSYRWSPDQSAEQRTQAQLWATRNRFNANMWTPPEYGGYYQVDFAHAYFQLVPVKEYYEDHPEYFALIDGRRSDNPDAQLCLGNPDVQELVAQKIIRDAKDNPQKIWFSLEPNDTPLWCEDALCRAMDDPNLKTAEGKVSMSNRVSLFNNIIARRLAKEVPGAKVASLAYSYSLHIEAPTLTKLEPNSVIGAATYGENYSDFTRELLDPQSEANARFVKVLREHRDLAELFTYEYWSGYMWHGPLPVLDVMADRLQKYHRDFNVQGVYNEFHQSWGPQGINHYFFARLMWNPDRDMKSELEEYCRNYYGPAAAPMLAYHRLLNDAAKNGPYFGSGGLKIENLFDDALLSRMGVLLAQARGAIGAQEPYLRRFEGVAAGHRVAQLTHQIVQLKNENRRDEALKAIDELEAFILADKNGEIFDNGPGIFKTIFRVPLRWRQELQSETAP